ncbi:Cas9 endonuclease PAM-interacting domain-containing protein [Lactimicrobium massiliense]|uniref:Cas9 endonuclease PAM-interacting domain-containing protein n=1 Tax=Lactimicrobium massiliense TaxID=2161814 RepID=UPI001435633F
MKIALQILKVFKCNRELSDLSLIGLSKNSGVITINNTLDKVMSAFLIYQSPTGLTEKKVNLLK